MNQTEKVLEYMQRFGAITPKEADVAIGCTRLAARIKEIKKQGHDVRTEMIPVRNRDGKIVRVAKYSVPPVVCVTAEPPIPQWKCEKCGQTFGSRHKNHVWCPDCRIRIHYRKRELEKGQPAEMQRMLYYEFMERGCEELTGEERRLHNTFSA